MLEFVHVTNQLLKATTIAFYWTQSQWSGLQEIWTDGRPGLLL